MGSQRYCDACRFYKPDVKRYGLSRQVPVPGETRGPDDKRAKTKRQQNFGGIDICDECWDRIGKPKQRPELRGRTGPKP